MGGTVLFLEAEVTTVEDSVICDFGLAGNERA